MTRCIQIVACVLGLGAALLCAESRGDPVIRQYNPNYPNPGPQLWTLTPVEGMSNTWDLEVEGVFQEPPEPPGCANQCPTTPFEVERGSSQPVVIRHLIINRPAVGGVAVHMGFTYFDSRNLTSVGTIWAHPQDQDDRHGYVRVFASLDGSLGQVDNVNALAAYLGGWRGSVRGPTRKPLSPAAWVC